MTSDGEEVGVALNAGQSLQDGHGRIGEWHSVFPAGLHPCGGYGPNGGIQINLVPLRLQHLAGAGGGKDQKPKRQCRNAAVGRQLCHEGGHLSVGHGGVVADLLHLRGLWQQLVQVAAPAGGVKRITVFKVGVFSGSACRASMGSTPSFANFRHLVTLSRASASPTSGKLPNPISRRLPSMVKRSTHFFAPVLETTSRRPLLSSYLPGSTVAALRGGVCESPRYYPPFAGGRLRRQVPQPIPRFAWIITDDEDCKGI